MRARIISAKVEWESLTWHWHIYLCTRCCSYLRCHVLLHINLSFKVTWAFALMLCLRLAGSCLLSLLRRIMLGSFVCSRKTLLWCCFFFWKVVYNVFAIISFFPLWATISFDESDKVSFEPASACCWWTFVSIDYSTNDQMSLRDNFCGPFICVELRVAVCTCDISKLRSRRIRLSFDRLQPPPSYISEDQRAQYNRRHRHN